MRGRLSARARRRGHAPATSAIRTGRPSRIERSAAIAMASAARESAPVTLTGRAVGDRPHERPRLLRVRPLEARDGGSRKSVAIVFRPLTAPWPAASEPSHTEPFVASTSVRTSSP